MKKIIVFVLLTTAIHTEYGFSQTSDKDTVIRLSKIFADAGQQAGSMLKGIPMAKGSKPDLVSPRTLVNDSLKLVASRDWTCGFFPGELWFLYEYTKKNEWKKQAENFTANIEREKTNGTTHDMGFKIYCSFGQ